MKRRTLLQSIPALALLGKAAYAQQAGSGQKSTAVYELRVYHTYEGKLDDLLTRFREHTMRLFEKHGMKNIAYWTPTDDPLRGKTLFYVIAHPSREAATATGKHLATTRNGKACGTSPRSAGSWWRKLI